MTLNIKFNSFIDVIKYDDELLKRKNFKIYKNEIIN